MGTVIEIMPELLRDDQELKGPKRKRLPGASMEVPIEAPLAIKKGIAKRLQRSGALKRVEHKIKLGMMVAVEELREDPNAPGHLERHRFKNASPYELKALQCVYNFLSQHNLTYTLSALIEESAVPRVQSESADIISLVRAVGGSDLIDDEEEDGELSLLVKGTSAPISRGRFQRNALDEED
jgi:hypothetical protein